jgi:hypothetical protein
LTADAKFAILLQETIWAMIEETFSNKTITPGITSTTDLEWTFREHMQNVSLKLYTIEGAADYG